MKKIPAKLLSFAVGIGLFLLIMSMRPNTVELIFIFITGYFIIAILSESRWSTEDKKRHGGILAVLGLALLIMVILFPPPHAMSEGNFTESKNPNASLLTPAYIFGANNDLINISDDATELIFPANPAQFYIKEEVIMETADIEFDITISTNFEFSEVKVVRYISDSQIWRELTTPESPDWVSSDVELNAEGIQTTIVSDSIWSVEMSKIQNWGSDSEGANEMFMHFIIIIDPTGVLNPDENYLIEMDMDSDKDDAENYNVFYSYAGSSMWMPPGAQYLAISAAVIFATYVLIFGIGLIGKRPGVFNYRIFLIIIAVFILVFYIAEVLRDYALTGFSLPWLPWPLSDIYTDGVVQVIYVIVAVIQWLISVGIVTILMTVASSYVESAARVAEIDDIDKVVSMSISSIKSEGG